MKLPKPLVELAMKLSMYQAFYEKVVSLIHTEGVTVDDITQVVIIFDNQIKTGAFRDLPEYKKLVNQYKF